MIGQGHNIRPDHPNQGSPADRCRGISVIRLVLRHRPAHRQALRLDRQVLGNISYGVVRPGIQTPLPDRIGSNSLA